MFKPKSTSSTAADLPSKSPPPSPKKRSKQEEIEATLVLGDVANVCGLAHGATYGALHFINPVTKLPGIIKAFFDKDKRDSTDLDSFVTQVKSLVGDTKDYVFAMIFSGLVKMKESYEMKFIATSSVRLATRTEVLRSQPIFELDDVLRIKAILEAFYNPNSERWNLYLLSTVLLR